MKSFLNYFNILAIPIVIQANSINIPLELSPFNVFLLLPGLRFELHFKELFHFFKNVIMIFRSVLKSSPA